jgi:hypothetical protein
MAHICPLWFILLHQANRASSNSEGHAVKFDNSSKKRNTTARAATAMDSAKNGPAGGWE